MRPHPPLPVSSSCAGGNDVIRAKGPSSLGPPGRAAGPTTIRSVRRAGDRSGRAANPGPAATASAAIPAMAPARTTPSSRPDRAAMRSTMTTARAAASCPQNALAERSAWCPREPEPAARQSPECQVRTAPGIPGSYRSRGADAAAGDTGRDDPHEEFPGARGPGLDAGLTDRVLSGTSDVVSRALDEDAPALPGDRVDA